MNVNTVAEHFSLQQLCLHLIIVGISLANCLAEPALEIISPPDETVVHPGETFDIVVRITEPEKFDQIVMYGSLFNGFGPLVPSASELRLPYTVPTKSRRGRFGAIAISRIKDTQQRVDSPDWSVSVEELDESVASLVVTPKKTGFRYAGSQTSLSLYALRTSGEKVPISSSTQLLLASNNETVAKVHPGGTIVAMGPGEAIITVGYAGKLVNVPVTVHDVQKGDLDGNDILDATDYKHMQSWIGIDAVSAADARDLNGDLRIDEADLLELQRRCTRPRCSISTDGEEKLPDVIAPTVAITSPLPGTAVSRSVTVAATVTDDDVVAGVQFQLDGNNLLSEDVVAPYSISWDSRKSVNGPHLLTAVARDAGGNSTTSAPISVTVTKGLPSPTPTPGSCGASGMVCSSNSQCCSNSCRGKKCA